MSTLIYRLTSLFNKSENLLLILSMVFMILLPILEILLRYFFNVGIENVSGLNQHMTLIVGTIGAAIAAREKKLLAFVGLDYLKIDLVKKLKNISTHISVSVCSLLIYSSMVFIYYERQGGEILAYGIPVWVFELTIPIALLSISLSLIKNRADNLKQVILSIIVPACIILFVIYSPLSQSLIRDISIILLIIAAIFGQPIFIIIGGIGLILFWSDNIPLASMSVNHYSLVTNPSLPAIPLFTMAGYFLADSKAPQRLIELFDFWFGRIKGGTIFASVLVCTFFTCFTGASGVTILALGGLVMPLMINAGYSRKVSLGMLTGGGSAGVLLLPALPLLFYAIIANIPIDKMFLGGVFPALLMMTIAIAWGLFQSTTHVKTKNTRFDKQRALRATWEAKWELAIPLVLLVSMFSGIMTPLEAAAITACYTLVVEVFIMKDLSLIKDVPNSLVKCGSLIGGILLILGVALGLTNYMVDAEIPVKAVALVQETIKSPWVFLLALNLFLLVVGFFIDIFSAIVVLVPLIIPMGIAFGIDPVHLGIIFLANLELGYLTPPVGMNLFFSSARFDKSLLEVCLSVLPLFLCFAAGVLIITYVPWLSTFLPGLIN